MYKVIIVDDHLLFASSLERLVATFPNFKVVFKAGNGAELQEYLTHSNEIADIILLDIKMPVMNGLETLMWLKKNYPDIKVIMLTMEDDENTVIKMLRNGANGYLLKDTDPDSLELALNETLTYGSYFTDRVSNLLNKSNGENFDNIDLREHEITFLKLACTEMTYKEIAEVMNLSPKTIDGYRHDLFTKLNVKNRVGLVLYAMKHNFI